MTETNRGVATMQHSAVHETVQGADQRADQGSGQIAVSVTDLRLKFPGEKAFVFKDVSLSVPAGEKVLLLGPSGCGKSTLLQVLGGLIPAVIDVPLKYADIRKPRSCGYVFQDPDTQFCMPYVDEELAFVLENRQVAREDMVPRMREALGRVGLDLEELHTPIERLSLGMKQRLALASVLLLEPEVLLLDEPSALLDPEGRQQIWEAVRGVSAGRTVLIVEHRIEEIVNWVDRIVLFAPDGSILADGKPAEIFTAYRRTLQENGIWYPGVWEDYIRHRDTWNSGLVQSPQQGADLAAPVLSLRGFVGLRGDAPAIMVEEAEVYAGDFVAVVGPNGAGKSSLLLSLMQLLPTAGSYVLEGRLLQGRGRKRTCPSDRIGFVFQNPEFQFVAQTVLEETAFSLHMQGGMSRAEVERKAEDCLKTFHLHGLENRHPYQLSTGQKRRLSVATAAVRRQAVLLLDEPTFGQDARNAFAILEYCEALRRSGTAIIMVTHEREIAELAATQVWEIQGGSLTAIKPGRRRLEGEGAASDAQEEVSG